MGVKHLRTILFYLKKNKGWVCKTNIRNDLNIDLNTVKECLSFLLQFKKIKKKEIKGIVRYKYV